LRLDPRVKPEDDDREVGAKVPKATAEYAAPASAQQNLLPRC